MYSDRSICSASSWWPRSRQLSDPSAWTFASGSRENEPVILLRIEESGRLAGDGWQRIGGGAFTFGIVERIDDVCTTAYVYCREPQRVDLAGAVADLERRPYESVDPMETLGTPHQRTSLGPDPGS
jgi:hypothetical protein